MQISMFGTFRDAVEHLHWRQVLLIVQPSKSGLQAVSGDQGPGDVKCKQCNNYAALVSQSTS
jgi:hypothetical protein